MLRNIVEELLWEYCSPKITGNEYIPSDRYILMANHNTLRPAGLPLDVILLNTAMRKMQKPIPIWLAQPSSSYVFSYVGSPDRRIGKKVLSLIKWGFDSFSDQIYVDNPSINAGRKIIKTSREKAMGTMALHNTQYDELHNTVKQLSRYNANILPCKISVDQGRYAIFFHPPFAYSEDHMMRELSWLQS